MKNKNNNNKNRRALGTQPPNPRWPPAAGGLCLQIPNFWRYFFTKALNGKIGALLLKKFLICPFRLFKLCWLTTDLDISKALCHLLFYKQLLNLHSIAWFSATFAKFVWSAAYYPVFQVKEPDTVIRITKEIQNETKNFHF